MAFLAQTSGQKGIIWWAAQHRKHHRHSDDEYDIHSSWRHGFWWSHIGWILSVEHVSYEPREVADLECFPELKWLNRHHWMPLAVFGLFVLCVGGNGAFVWGFIVSTVLLYHCVFSINSLAHIVGTRRFGTPDQSRNNWILALVTFGEGWHNNHHFSMASSRHGFRWWEIDLTYALLKLLSFAGVVRDLRPVRRLGAKTERAAG